jgi:hypothetical protein
MTPPRADKTGETPPKTPAQLTLYTLFRPVQDVDLDDQDVTLWRRATPNAIAAHGAHDAIRRWANDQGDAFAGGQVMAVPERSLTIVDVKVETRRQLHLGSA